MYHGMIINQRKIMNQWEIMYHRIMGRSIHESQEHQNQQEITTLFFMKTNWFPRVVPLPFSQPRITLYFTSLEVICIVPCIISPLDRITIQYYSTVLYLHSTVLSLTSSEKQSINLRYGSTSSRASSQVTGSRQLVGILLPCTR